MTTLYYRMLGLNNFFDQFVNMLLIYLWYDHFPIESNWPASCRTHWLNYWWTVGRKFIAWTFKVSILYLLIDTMCLLRKFNFRSRRSIYFTQAHILIPYTINDHLILNFVQNYHWVHDFWKVICNEILGVFSHDYE